MARVLITGGGGFIARHLSRLCRDEGDEVHVTVRPVRLSQCLSEMPQTRVHPVALSDRTALDECLARVRPEVVYHLAVQTRRQPCADLSDALGSVNEDMVHLVTLLAAAAQAAHPPRAFVRAGSLAEYGLGPVPYRETQREWPLTSYAAALTAGTHYLQALRPRLPFMAVTARLALVYGPGQDESFLIPKLISSYLAREPIVIHRPDDRRDLLHVDDAANALRLLGQSTVAPDLINIATGGAHAVRDVVALIAEAFGSNASHILFSPAPPGPADVPNLVGSAARARDLLGWAPSVSLSDGLKRMVRPFVAEEACA